MPKSTTTLIAVTLTIVTVLLITIVSLIKPDKVSLKNSTRRPSENPPVTSVQPDLTLPIKRGGNYVLEFSNLYFEVDPQIGARIITFAIKGENILTGPSVNPENYGSTFWTSPQSDWEWPPIAVIDSEPYTARLEGNTIVMTSDVSAQLGVSITKTFSADLGKRAIVLNYRINNESSEPVTYAPWEISRVPSGGVVFYPTGEGDYNSGSFNLPEITAMNGITWVQYNPQTAPNAQKLYANGSYGWLASLTDRTLLIKSFPAISIEQQAPGEGEIEVYFNTPDSYIEVEPQGAYTEVPPGESLSWTVRWYLRKLPPRISADIGNEKLIRFVNRILGISEEIS